MMTNSLPKRILLLFFLIPLSCVDSNVVNEDLNLYDANQRAIEILAHSTRVHGDISWDSLQISVHAIVREGIHRGQSLVSIPPFENYALETKFLINRPKRIEFSQVHNRFAGFDFHTEFLSIAGQGRLHDINTKTYSESNSSGFDSFRYFPHVYLKNALSQSANLVLHGKKQGGDQRDYWEIGFRNGQTTGRLLIDIKTNLLARVERIRTYWPYGDGFFRIDFSDYTISGGLTLPQKVRSGGDYGAWGEVFNNFQLEIKEGADIELIDQEQYQNYIPGDYSYRSKAKLKNLGQNLFVIENIGGSTGQWSNNILLAEFDDYIMAFEATTGPATSKKVLEIADSVFPEKPIRYLVQSHHHSDHWAGIRDYIAIGAKIITGPGNEELLAGIAKAPFSLAPDSQWLNPRELELELVNQSFKLDDKLNAVEIYDIGPTGHAREMLIAYFPRQKLLWQADMLNYGEWSLDDPLVFQLVKKIKELDLSVNTIVGLHGKVLTGGKLAEVLERL